MIILSERLHVVQLLVESVQTDEFVVRAALNDAPLMKHAYFVGMLDGAQTVGDV